MAFLCVNKDSMEYLSLKNRANIPESILYAMCRSYLTKYDRFPHLDELPNVNSEEALKLNLHIHNESSSIKNILQYTNKQTVEEANVAINEEYRDLEVKIVPIVNDAIVKVRHRPRSNNMETYKVKQDEDINNFAVFGKIISKLSDLYGINFNYITDKLLSSPEWQQVVPDGTFVNGFVYNGEIYLNLDRMSTDTPIHEIMHLLVGLLRFSEPALYKRLVDSVLNWENYSEMLEQFPSRSRNDVNEEIFVTEVSKLLAGQDSQLLNASDKVKYEIKYNVCRLLDTMIMGQNSVKTINSEQLFNMSLKEIAEILDSEEFINNFTGTFNVQGSSLHRKLNNIKLELIKNNELIEQCD